MQTSNRLYLDYNATSPFSSSVLNWLKSEELLFANPSSVHSSGKSVKREINRVREYLFETFGLDEEENKLLFHSGASEGINTLIKGRANFIKSRGRRAHYFYLSTDHSCVCNLSECLEDNGHLSTKINVDHCGNFNDEKIIELISLAQEKGEENNKDHIILNYTWVNNESGVVLDLERAMKIKETTGCEVHIDAVQAVGKIENWNKLLVGLDAYSFSSHKFGSLKGSGFSFYKKSYEILPFIRGGGQQEGIRSGTENTLGIISTALALKDIERTYSFKEQNTAKIWFEKKLLELLGESGEIVALKHPRRNGNTIYFITYGVKAHTLSMAFDMAGIDVSNGSACSSGAVLPSRVLMGLGYSEEFSKSAIRLSFPHDFDQAKAQIVWEKFSGTLSRFI